MGCPASYLLGLGPPSPAVGSPSWALAQRNESADPPTDVVYDAWNRVIGITTYQLPILARLLLDFPAMKLKTWDPRPLTHAVETWLAESRRVVELSSGTTLTRAFFVVV